MAKKLWDDFDYKDLLEVPPIKKPCFLAGTLVSTPKGMIKIENIKKGDLVHAYNFKTSSVELKPVKELYRNKAEKYVNIHLAGGEIIKATGNHRFWIIEDKRWIPSRDLQNGKHFLNKAGEAVKIKEIKVVNSIVETYNFEVEEHPNYFVGKQAILTHNAGKESVFANLFQRDYEFYRFVDGVNMADVYVGQTIQGIGKRLGQHSYEYKKNPAKKPWFRGALFGEIEINGKEGPYRMTRYEASVVELHEISNRGGFQKNGGKLFNKAKPIGKANFILYKKIGNF